MGLSNFHRHKSKWGENFEGLNMMQTMLSVLFVLFNTLLANMVNDNIWMNVVLTITVWLINLADIFFSTMILTDDRLETIVSEIIFLFYAIIFMPVWLYITLKIKE